MDKVYRQFAIDDHLCDIHGGFLIEFIWNAYFDPHLEETVRFWKGARQIHEDVYVYPATPEGNALLEVATIPSKSYDTASDFIKWMDGIGPKQYC